MDSWRTNRIKGFTVVELLTVLALVSILISLFYFGLQITSKQIVKKQGHTNREMELLHFMNLINTHFSTCDSIQFQNLQLMLFKGDHVISVGYTHKTMKLNAENQEEKMVFDKVEVVALPSESGRIRSCKVSIELDNQSYYFHLMHQHHL